MGSEAVVKATVGTGPVVVFSKTYCPFCNQVKQLFAGIPLKAEPVVLELDIRDDGESIQDVLLKMTGGRR